MVQDIPMVKTTKILVMKKRILFVLIIIALIMVAGCTTKEKSSMKDYDAIMSIIETYVSENSNYNTFIMYDSLTDWFEDDEELSSEFRPGYFVGPCYEDLLKRHYCHNDLSKQDDFYSFIDVGKSRIYIFGSKKGWGEEKGKDNWVNKHPEDTVWVEGVDNKDPWIKKDPWRNYFCRAIYFYKKDDVWHVNHRPDTVFLLQRVETDIVFGVQEDSV